YPDNLPVSLGLLLVNSLVPSCFILVLGVYLFTLHLLDPFHDQLTLHESKGSMTPRKSRHCGTMA
ncbi:hypothetical protein BHM03_00032393, partial [Ensete ventricosum]